MNTASTNINIYILPKSSEDTEAPCCCFSWLYRNFMSFLLMGSSLISLSFVLFSATYIFCYFQEKNIGMLMITNVWVRW